MMRIFAAVVILALAACQQEQGPPPSGLAGYDPHLVETRRAECIQKGGRFGKGGLSGALVCYQMTGEELKSCSNANDCTGMCLARSRTCTPVTPFFGCNEVLTQSGAKATICID